MNTKINFLVEKFWGVEAIFPTEKAPEYKERQTWRINNNLWLTRVDINNASFLKEENRLLDELFLTLIKQDSIITVPKVVPTLNGEKLVIEEEHAWRMTQNIPDESFSPSDRNIYPLAIKALDELHFAFGAIKPHWSLLQLGVVETLSSELPRYLFEHSDPFVRSGTSWLEENFYLISKANKVLTHGEFDTCNIILRRNGHIKIIAGVVDFKMLRPDPAVMDYAQIFNNIICLSNIPDRDLLVQEVLQFMNYRYSLKEINTAMLAYWIEALLRVRRFPGPEKKAALRIRQILEFAKVTTG